MEQCLVVASADSVVVRQLSTQQLEGITDNSATKVWQRSMLNTGEWKMNQCSTINATMILMSQFFNTRNKQSILSGNEVPIVAFCI